MIDVPDQRTNVAAAIRSASRLIAISVVIAGGGIAFGISGGYAGRGTNDAETVSGSLIVAGAIAFVIEYVHSRRMSALPPAVEPTLPSA